MAKIKRAAEVDDRNELSFSGHAERYDNDFQYCYRQRQQGFPRVLRAPETIPQGQKGSGQRTGEHVVLEENYLSVFDWRSSKCYRLIRDRIADGSVERFIADVEPAVDISDLTVYDDSATAPDAKHGWGAPARFTENPRHENRPGAEISHDYRSNPEWYAEHPPRGGRNRDSGFQAYSAGGPPPSLEPALSGAPLPRERDPRGISDAEPPSVRRRVSNLQLDLSRVSRGPLLPSSDWNPTLPARSGGGAGGSSSAREERSRSHQQRDPQSSSRDYLTDDWGTGGGSGSSSARRDSSRNRGRGGRRYS